MVASKVERTDYGVKFVIAHALDAEDLRVLAVDTRVVCRSILPGFMVLTDLTGVVSLPPETEPYVRALQHLAIASGMSRAYYAHSSATTVLQFKRLSDFHGTAGRVRHELVGDRTDWESEAVRWLSG